LGEWLQGVFSGAHIYKLTLDSPSTAILAVQQE